MLQRANSSSCGRSQPASIMSIGRVEGSSQRSSGGTNHSVQTKVERREAFVGLRVGVPRVEDQQLVQQRGAAPPVAEHEQRRLGELRSTRTRWREHQFVEHAGEGVEHRRLGDAQGHRNATGRDGEPIAREQPQPSGEAHAVPEPRGPDRIGMRPRRDVGYAGRWMRANC